MSAVHAPPRRTLTLIRHSISAPTDGIPAAAWPLSEEGRRACLPLAETIAALRPARLYTSTEPKAAETGRLVGAVLGLPVAAEPGLHEHERAHTRWMGRPQFESAVENFFAQPDKLVFGDETAYAALERFTQAVDRVLARHPAESLAIVTHGTVMALFVQARCGIEPFPFWRALRMPAWITLELPGFVPR